MREIKCKQCNFKAGWLGLKTHFNRAHREMLPYVCEIVDVPAGLPRLESAWGAACAGKCSLSWASEQAAIDMEGYEDRGRDGNT